MQSKSSECGLIAKPCAIEIAERRNPVVCQRDGSQMRPYLKRCFTEGKLQRFLYTKKHRVSFECRVRQSVKESICYICRMPNDRKLAMTEWTSCWKWYRNSFPELITCPLSGGTSSLKTFWPSVIQMISRKNPSIPLDCLKKKHQNEVTGP